MVTKEQWIPVTDRLPAMKSVVCDGWFGEELRYDISRPVLGCTAEGRMAVVCLTTVPDSDPVWIDEPGSEYAIAYWMPLPQGPEAPQC